MTNEHPTTREEEAYGRLLEKVGEMLSEAARTVFGEAESAAYGMYMVHNCPLQPEEYDEAMDKMTLAAAELTARDCELLAKLWRAALAAAASIDPDDETPAGHRIDRGDIHRYYRVVSGMVEEVLRERKFAERRNKAAQREPEDLSDFPF